MKTIPDYFGCLAFGEEVMRARLPKDTYKALKRTMDLGKRLPIEHANVIANAMKDWAVENGATHYTHWFQPMTGITAEKHDSFISPAGNGKVIMEFSGKELVKGEPDASSFPSGGLRATFEARGYTAWDPTSYVFIKDGVLCIPTAFCSYGGEALDKKTPLLRSMEALSKEAVRVLQLFGNTDVTAVKSTVGPEQEYFLIPKDLYDKRKDLIYTGRTLFGAMPPKGQELDDHYFGVIKTQVADFMKDLNEELWKLGILAMELMQKIAKKHGMVCLLHEKPFAGVNGSGKHNNWSISTNTGVNLLEPGETPYDNAQFLLFLCAVIKAVDNYQDLIRISACGAGNDHRLGANEAPPAVVSMFLGEELTEILESIETGTAYDAKEKVQMKVGVHVLPRFTKDTTDRNRTSPFAFTGNKFEFRMLGSSASISSINTMLNTAVAESLKSYADELEGAKDFTDALNKLIRRTIKDHKRIIFNGNGYDAAWLDEAEKRGLLNLRSTPDCVPYLLAEKNVKLLTSHKVFTEVELHARYEILLENYSKVIHIEALTMIDMVNHEILPAISSYTKELLETALVQKEFGVSSYEEERAKKLSALSSGIYDKVGELEEALIRVSDKKDLLEEAQEYKSDVFMKMQSLRASVDEAETVTSSKYWPLPSYGELLFGVR